MTETNEVTRTAADVAAGVYREEREGGASAEVARLNARNRAAVYVAQKGLPAEARRAELGAVDDVLESLAGQQIADDTADHFERHAAAETMTASKAEEVLAVAARLRADKRASAADRVELALCRAALRAVVALSNEAPVRQLAMAARGM